MAEIKRWTGSAWEVASLKYWNGSAWEEVGGLPTGSAFSSLLYKSEPAYSFSASAVNLQEDEKGFVYALNATGFKKLDLNNKEIAKTGSWSYSSPAIWALGHGNIIVEERNFQASYYGNIRIHDSETGSLLTDLGNSYDRGAISLETGDIYVSYNSSYIRRFNKNRSLISTSGDLFPGGDINSIQVLEDGSVLVGSNQGWKRINGTTFTVIASNSTGHSNFVGSCVSRRVFGVNTSGTDFIEVFGIDSGTSYRNVYAPGSDYINSGTLQVDSVGRCWFTRGQYRGYVSYIDGHYEYTTSTPRIARTGDTSGGIICITRTNRLLRVVNSTIYVESIGADDYAFTPTVG